MKKIFSFLLSLISIEAFAQTNLVVNPNFTDGHDGWTLSYQKPADTARYVVTYEDGIQVEQTKAATGRIQIMQNIAITPGKSYTLSFEYKATAEKLRLWSYEISDVNVWMYLGDSAAVDPLRTNNNYLPIATEWTADTLEFTTLNADTVNTFCLQFRVFKSENTTVNIRNVSLIEMETAEALDEVKTGKRVSKLFKNGEIIIIKDDTEYNVLGIKK